ncbi:MAG: acyl-CoA dehydrogenase family protein [Novosphingobium sp.]
MIIDLSELQDSAHKAFPASDLMPARDASWKTVGELGWLLIDLPEELGGLGLPREAAAAILYELGKGLGSAPLTPALLALRALASADHFSVRADWIDRICGGEYVPLNMLPGKLEASADGRLSGTVSGLFEADMASHVLVGASGAYRLIPTDAPGVTLTERPLWDSSRRLFDLRLDGVASDSTLLVADGADAIRLHEEIARSAHLFVAADSLGGAHAALDMSVEYLKVRKQFDRPLAMFQALKHRCADLKIAIVTAEALFWARAHVADTIPVVDLGAMKALATDTYRMVTEEAIQLHGGIGLTEEYPIHHYMKRAMVNLQLCGSLDYWRGEAGQAALAALS